VDLNDYLAENGNWIRVDATATITGLAPAEWRAVVIAAAELGGSEPGIDCLVVVEADELADIEARVAGWLHPGVAARIDCGGFLGVLFRGTKRRRSREPARTWIVVDLGERRVVLA
jgi:hypothetical protein